MIYLLGLFWGVGSNSILSCSSQKIENVTHLLPLERGAKETVYNLLCDGEGLHDVHVAK